MTQQQTLRIRFHSTAEYFVRPNYMPQGFYVVDEKGDAVGGPFRSHAEASAFRESQTQADDSALADIPSLSVPWRSAASDADYVRDESFRLRGKS